MAATLHRNSPDWREATRLWWRLRRGVPPSADTPTTPTYSDPRSQQWNFQIERQLSATSMASIAYVGSHTQRLEWCCKANYPQGGPFCENNPAQGFTCPGTPLTPAQINQPSNICRLRRKAGTTRSPPGFRPSMHWRPSTRSASRTGSKPLVAFTWEKCLGDSNGDFNAENGSEGAPYEYFFNAHSVEGRLHLRHPESVHLDRRLPIAVRPWAAAG